MHAACRGKKTVTVDGAKSMPNLEAAEIYRRSYRSQAGSDLLPPTLRYFFFNNGAMSEPKRAVKTLRKAVGVRGDGHIGKRTLAVVRC